MRYTETRDDDAVSPVIGVILMVAITVILAAVIGTFVLGLGDDVGNTPSAGVSTSQTADSLTFTLVSTGNVDALQLTTPSGNQSTVLGAGLQAGASVNLRSDGAVNTYVSDNITLITGFDEDTGAPETETFDDVDDVPDEIEPHLTCLYNHGGFEVGGVDIPPSVEVPCSTPIIGSLDAVETGTEIEEDVGAPITLEEGEYQLLGIVDGDEGVIQSVTFG